MTQKINLEANLVAIAAVLAAHGIHQVASYYSGSGDSGDEFRQTAYDANGDEIDMPEVEVACEHRVYVPTKNGGYGYAIKQEAMSLESAISDATGQAIGEAGHSGWENNEGGKGTLTIYASGYAELNHTNYYEGDADYQYHDFGADSIFGESLAAVAAVLKVNGCSEVQGEYYGSGDSGDGFDIALTGEDGHEADISIDADVSYLVVENIWENGKFTPQKSTRTADFDQAVEDICFAMVSHTGNDGWENNEGGGGKVIIKADGTARLEHYNNGEDDGTDSTTVWNEALQKEDDIPCEED